MYVSEQEYNRYRYGHSEMKAYVGSVFSFGGSMFGSYIGRLQSVAATKKKGEGSYRKLMKIVPLLDNIDVKPARDYDRFTPHNLTIYCDPPYDTASKFSNKYLNGFDHKHFWNVMRIWSKNNLVFISELKRNVPPDFSVVWSKTIKRSFNPTSAAKEQTESLCVHKSWLGTIDGGRLTPLPPSHPFSYLTDAEVDMIQRDMIAEINALVAQLQLSANLHARMAHGPTRDAMWRQILIEYRSLRTLERRFRSLFPDAPPADVLGPE